MRVIILRGISGAGKSTWVKNNVPPEAAVVSADHFFVQPDGTYLFDPTKLQAAHEVCFRAFMDAVTKKTGLVVVDNTNVTAWEMAPYVLAGKAYGYDVEILTLECDAETAIARKDLVSPSVVRAKANQLEREERSFPPSYKAIHRKISTC